VIFQDYMHATCTVHANYYNNSHLTHRELNRKTNIANNTKVTCALLTSSQLTSLHGPNRKL